MSRRLFIIGLAVLAISACTLYRKPDAPKLTTPTKFKYTIAYQNKTLPNNWWENFKDPKLNQLVSLSVKNNYNYLATLKNIDIARTFVDQNKSNLYPQVNANFYGSRNQLSQNSIFNTSTNLTSSTTLGVGTGTPGANTTEPFNAYQLYGSVTYEIDIWNQIHNSVYQAQANVDTAFAQAQIVKLTLITSVVSTYLQINAAAVNLANLRQQLYFANEILVLTRDQYKSGLVDMSVVDDAKNQVEAIKTNLVNVEKQRQTLQTTLAYLVGEYPESFNIKYDNTFRNPGFSKLIPAGLPSQMLANRPDIQAAYFQILSYGYLEKQNIANFLPAFTLTGNYGYASTVFSTLLAGNSVFWNYGLTALQPLFDAGMRMSLYNRSKYQYEQAVLTYKDTVVNAFKEVDAALVAYKNDFEALKSYQNQVNNYKEKSNLARAQYKGGLIDYSTYLTSQLSYYQADYNLINQRLAVAQDVIQVYKALAIGL